MSKVTPICPSLLGIYICYNVLSFRDAFFFSGNTLSSENAYAKSTIGDTGKLLAAESTSGDNLKLTSTVQESAAAKTSLFEHPCDHEGSSGSPKLLGKNLPLRQTNLGLLLMVLQFVLPMLLNQEGLPHPSVVQYLAKQL